MLALRYLTTKMVEAVNHTMMSVTSVTVNLYRKFSCVRPSKCRFAFCQNNLSAYHSSQSAIYCLGNKKISYDGRHRGRKTFQMYSLSFLQTFALNRFGNELYLHLVHHFLEDETLLMFLKNLLPSSGPVDVTLDGPSGSSYMRTALL